jgi:tRNA A-37 threonylcarbamoyl transferase component Bud32
MPVRIHILKGNDVGNVILIPDGENRTLGRSKTADVRIDDPLLSRQHVRIAIQDGVARLTDLNSSNGTYLNGEKVAEARVVDGDRFKIGSHVFHIEVLPPGAALTGAAGSRAAAAAAVAAIASGPPLVTRGELKFCRHCHKALAFEGIVEPTPGDVLCVDCADGKTVESELIEGFQLIEKIGEGKLGPVFKARHLTLMKNVAIKVVRSDRAVDEQCLRRFMREAKIGGRLFHPHIVEMYDAAVSDGHYYISMEYVEGETLDERIHRTGPVAWQEATSIGLKVADALRYAFEHRIIHRNVRPANVFLGRKGEVKLADFGLAKAVDETDPRLVTPPGVGKGTLFYTSPEQLTDARQADQRSDVYALGATLYFAVVGVPPFDAPSVPEVVQNILEGHLVPVEMLRPDCPRELTVAIGTCLAREKERRFPTPGDLLAALRTVPAG